MAEHLVYPPHNSWQMANVEFPQLPTPLVPYEQYIFLIYPEKRDNIIQHRSVAVDFEDELEYVNYEEDCVYMNIAPPEPEKPPVIQQAAPVEPVWRPKHKWVQPQLNDRVEMCPQQGDTAPRYGTVMYIGETKFASGPWVGVQFDDPIGKNDGSVNGKRYFVCCPYFGSFVRPTAVFVIPKEEVEAEQAPISEFSALKSSLKKRPVSVAIMPRRQQSETLRNSPKESDASSFGSAGFDEYEEATSSKKTSSSETEKEKQSSAIAKSSDEEKDEGPGGPKSNIASLREQSEPPSPTSDNSSASEKKIPPPVPPTRPKSLPRGVSLTLRSSSSTSSLRSVGASPSNSSDLSTFSDSALAKPEKPPRPASAQVESESAPIKPPKPSSLLEFPKRTSSNEINSPYAPKLESRKLPMASPIHDAYSPITNWSPKQNAPPPPVIEGTKDSETEDVRKPKGVVKKPKINFAVAGMSESDTSEKSSDEF